MQSSSLLFATVIEPLRPLHHATLFSIIARANAGFLLAGTVIGQQREINPQIPGLTRQLEDLKRTRQGLYADDPQLHSDYDLYNRITRIASGLSNTPPYISHLSNLLQEQGYNPSLAESSNLITAICMCEMHRASRMLKNNPEALLGTLIDLAEHFSISEDNPAALATV